MKKILIFVLLLILAELYLILLLGQYIGDAYAIVYIVFSAIAGYALTYKYLMHFKNGLFEKIKKHELSYSEVSDWLVALMGALFILVPGILTDMAGIILSVKASRQLILQNLWPLIKDSTVVTIFRIRLKAELEKKGLQDFL